MLKFNRILFALVMLTSTQALSTELSDIRRCVEKIDRTSGLVPFENALHWKTGRTNQTMLYGQDESNSPGMFVLNRRGIYFCEGGLNRSDEEDIRTLSRSYKLPSQRTIQTVNLNTNTPNSKFTWRVQENLGRSGQQKSSGSYKGGAWTACGEKLNNHSKEVFKSSIRNWVSSAETKMAEIRKNPSERLKAKFYSALETCNTIDGIDVTDEQVAAFIPKGATEATFVKGNDSAK